MEVARELKSPWDRSPKDELLGMALTIAILGVISIFTGGFWWMTGVVIAGEALWLATKGIRNYRVRQTA